MEVSEVKQQQPSSPAQTRFVTISPPWKLSPKHSRSTLYYDSFELRAVARQLNKAIQASNATSPPFHRKQLARIHKENGNVPRKISIYWSGRSTLDKKPSTRSTNTLAKGFVARLWKKVRQGWLRNDQKPL
ncbi:hypothetical protein CRG98_031891 [Punica granatum]|uniref:Uncharacterized protein n=1 Tax=Punica granatum TaxID=22663 RepID=A0A2I0IUV0_PUNGR|nr:hypothetical protein CRG98_031891 [Punica granatum]